MTRIKFKIPDEVKKKYTGTKCPKCKSPLFNFNGTIVCPGCQTRKMKEDARKFRESNMDNRLDEYNKQQMLKRMNKKDRDKYQGV